MLYTKELFISLTVLIGVQIYRTENCLWSSIGSSVIHTELLFWARVSIGVTPGHERACVSSSNQTGLPQRILFIPLKVQRPEKHQVKKKKKVIWKHASRNKAMSDGSGTDTMVGGSCILPRAAESAHQLHFPVSLLLLVKSVVQYGINTNECQTFLPFPAAKRFAYFCSQYFLKHILYKCIWRLYSSYFPRKISQSFKVRVPKNTFCVTNWLQG